MLQSPSIMNTHLMKTLLLATALGLGLSGCDRYFDTPQCGAVFEPGQTEGFELDTQGSALHKASGVRWYRCSAGQRFANGQCIGEPLLLNQEDAQKYARDFSAASGRTWRLPTVDEMQSITVKHCKSPALNPNVFPSIRIDNYWTSSRSFNGPGLGCTTYTYNGNSFCKEARSIERPFLLVLE